MEKHIIVFWCSLAVAFIYFMLLACMKYRRFVNVTKAYDFGCALGRFILVGNEDSGFMQYCVVDWDGYTIVPYAKVKYKRVTRLANIKGKVYYKAENHAAKAIFCDGKRVTKWADKVYIEGEFAVEKTKTYNADSEKRWRYNCKVYQL